MALLTATEIGLFRANENANPNNNLKLVDPTTPGTSGTDTLAAYDSALATQFDGINYVGKDGVENFLTFFRLENPTAEKIPYAVLVSEGAAPLEAAIRLVVEQHEVDPVVTVAKSGADYTIVHVGAGTLDDVVVDGADQATART